MQVGGAAQNHWGGGATPEPPPPDPPLQRWLLFNSNSMYDQRQIQQHDWFITDCSTLADKLGQVNLAETDENGNENEKGNGRQEGYKCGIGQRPCKPTLSCKIVWCILRLVTGSRQAALASYIHHQWRIQGWCLGCLGTTLGSKEDHRFSMKGLARQLSRHLPQAKKTSIYHELTSKCD